MEMTWTVGRRGVDSDDSDGRKVWGRFESNQDAIDFLYQHAQEGHYRTRGEHTDYIVLGYDDAEIQALGLDFQDADSFAAECGHRWVQGVSMFDWQGVS